MRLTTKARNENIDLVVTLNQIFKKKQSKSTQLAVNHIRVSLETKEHNITYFLIFNTNIYGYYRNLYFPFKMGLFSLQISICPLMWLLTIKTFHLWFIFLYFSKINLTRKLKLTIPNLNIF